MRKTYKVRTEKQKEAVAVNNALRTFAALRFALMRTGHYQFEQRVRALEEEFRHATQRKEL